MEYILMIFIVVVIFSILWKRNEKKKLDKMYLLIEKIGKREDYPDICEELKEIYEETVGNIRSQDAQLTNSVNEIRIFKDELNVTYDSLLKKSAQLEYTNEELEKKVANLSNINAIARTVLSTLELDKIIGVILDAYFVLTGVKKIAIYLWNNNGELELKKSKGKFIKTGSKVYLKKDMGKEGRGEYKKLYKEISHSIQVMEDESVVISDLVVKGKELGVIYILEDKDKLSNSDEAMISALAIQVAVAINNALIYSELIIKERIDNELQVASSIQKRLLPQSMEDIHGIQIAQYFNPAKEVGGDYYDYSLSGENKLWVTIGDVSGKGVPAAFLMALIRSVLKTLEYKDSYPAEVLTELNDIIYPDINEDMFVTIFHSQYDFLTKTLYYSNAGHNPLILYKSKENKVIEENIKGVAIGFLESYDYRLGKIKLEKGDVLLYYTDGLTEAESVEKELYGIERLKEVIERNHELSSEGIKQKLLQSLDEFVNEKEQIDDMTFVILKIEA